MKDRMTRSPLGATLADIVETVLIPAKHLTGGSVGARIVYGKDSSMMLATRQPGYHSKPHSHDSEQLNYVLEGELLVFIDNECLLVRKGDTFRIPRNAVHWSWVRGIQPSVLLETHSPPMIGDAGVAETATALLYANENRDGITKVKSDWPSDFDRDAVEAVIFNNNPHLKQ